MRREAKRSIRKNLTLDDRPSHLIGPALQPLPGGNQSACVVRLFGGASAFLHDDHNQRHHVSVESG
jgi:hypothetical protein